jgi:6-pyruvoyltetrahydropterin/6-carboxytetrahydropterin synthase
MPATYEVMVEKMFSAANRVAGYVYDGRPDEVHGHNFVVQVYVACSHLDAANVAVDEPTIEAALAPLLKKFHYAAIHTLPEAFDSQGRQLSTSVEWMTRFFYKALKPQLPGLSKVVLYETRTDSCTYWE